MSGLQAFILGMVQGVTEFLPVSSSGHLVLFPWFFQWKDPGLAYSVFLHLGTLVAVFGYFFKDWMRLFAAGFRSLLERRIGFEKERRQFWFLVLASLPAVIAGLFLHEYAETIFRTPLIVAVGLAVVGFFLYWIDGTSPAIRTVGEIKAWDAFLIGVAQALAIIPGVSRSGATMTMGRWLGLKREDAARFSFLMSFPIILGAAVFELPSLTGAAMHELSSSYLVIGFLSSAFFGFVSIHFLLLFLRQADFRVFAWYRIALAFVILGWSFFKT